MFTLCIQLTCMISFFPRINLGTGILQFAVLPLVLEKLAQVRHWLWLVMPVVVLFPAVWMTQQSAGSFEVVTAAFCIMKTLEYSLRGALTETVRNSLSWRPERNFHLKQCSGIRLARLREPIFWQRDYQPFCQSLRQVDDCRRTRSPKFFGSVVRIDSADYPAVWRCNLARHIVQAWKPSG
jgi:hypothetical protein